MQYSNELKVGAAIVIAVFVAFAGIRFFQDVPLFGSSYTLYAEFDNANGLVSGNPVRMKGVKVGSVEGVRLNPETQTVRVRMTLERGPHVPKGSQATVSGISALGGVYVNILPGPTGNPQLASGATLQSPESTSAISQLKSRAPALAGKADSVLAGANTTIAVLNRLLQDPDSDLRRTLSSLRKMSGDLSDLTGSEKSTLRTLIRNLEGVSSDLETFTGENSDSLDLAVRRLNSSLDRLNKSLASFQNTSAKLDRIATKLNQGEGTAGRLINDPSLYMKLDSAATQTNRLLLDFQDDPARYLEDMTLVKVF
ncbi:MAG: MCE family protein [Bacteroidetes bacterium SW_9_63_38]|nr:MAG: MCE family protein [Bacteroidetes bacterium SW_9_63_38]